LDCKHEEIHTFVSKNSPEHDNVCQCLHCGEIGMIDDFPEAKIVEMSISLNKEILEHLKSEPDQEIGLKKLLTSGIKMQELRENCRDTKYIESLIRNKEFPFEDGDIEWGMLVMKLVALPPEKLDKILDELS